MSNRARNRIDKRRVALELASAKPRRFRERLREELDKNPAGSEPANVGAERTSPAKGKTMTNQSATPGEVRSSEQLGATTRKRYPLEVEGGQTDDGAYCMSKGHHDKAVFLAEARLWWGDEVQGWTEPEHKWLRVVPDPNEEWRRGLLMDAKPHSRGAFPVTFTESRSA